MRLFIYSLSHSTSLYPLVSNTKTRFSIVLCVFFSSGCVFLQFYLCLSSQKMSNRRPLKRALVQVDDDEEEDKFYKLKILLPNGTNVTLTLNNPQPEMSMRNFVNLVKEEYEKTRKSCELSGKMRKRIDWNLAAESYLDFNGEKIRGMVRLETFKPDMCNILRLDDGSGEATTMYENMWDLTPDTDMLKELPENYSFETALADLIDNSLQAVWSCSPGNRRLISVDVLEDRISVFDSGPGMDSSKENSIAKWGKIGASIHRAHKSKAIGGKPPYLMPFFGMFGYGGAYACMHLGMRTLVSSKTKQSKKVFTLQLNKEALIGNRSTSGKNWKVDGGMRDPLEEEMKLSPHGSFTKVEIFEWNCKIPEIYQLQCRLKDIYFPYIQYDEVSKTGRTLRPVEFQVHGEDLTEIVGGEVATTNLNSKGEEFWFQIRFCEKRKGTSQEANARLKFVYFPIVHGKERIDIIMESLEKEGYKVSESFQAFGRLSVRRLGRLLPEVPWVSIPFMERGARATTLQKCCQRVKCFVDLDAGFVPTPSKTDLASQNLFSVALKNFGSKSKEKDNDVSMVIHREGKSLAYGQVEKGYEEWVLKMHKSYDEEDALGEDEATVIFDSLDKKALCISPDCEAVRVHKVMKRKSKSWERGQKIKIMKGACAGVHKNDVYATIDYFLIENFEDETGGDARIICRQINFSEEEGCMLLTIKGISKLEIRKSSSFPISIIDTEKCVLIDDNEWNRKLVKQKEKDPSRIDLLDEKDCRTLKFNGETTIGASVCAGQTPPQQIVAVVRPASYTSSKLSKKLDQKHIVKMDGEMLMEVELQGTEMKSRVKNAKPLYSDRCFPTNRGGLHGLYIFQLESKIPHLFKKAGTYIFSFSVGNSVTCKKKVIVKPSSKVGSWKLGGNQETINVRVGSSLPPLSIYCLDEYENQIPFSSVPSLEVRLKASPEFEVPVYKIEANLDRGILKLMNMVVQTDALDDIRPDYEATLEICSRDEPFSVSVDCIVEPGPLKCVVEKDAHALENLLPDFTVENFILEMFDEYNNHVAEGTNVPICTSGFFIQDRMCLDLKVDSDGCIDLSGILKVTAGYGKPVSLSIMSGNKEIFKKESLVEIRELRLLTELPEYCTAGTNLTNLKFKVTDSYGIMDTSINNDDKSECFHTLSIESDSSSVDSTTRYAFVHGSCKITSLSLPETAGAFSFKVFHSRHPELHMNLKIQLTPAQTFERDGIGYSEPNPRIYLTPQSKMGSTTNPLVIPTQQTPPSQFRVLSIREISSAISSQTAPVDMEQFSEYTEILKAKLNSYNERISEANECLKCLEAEQEEAVQELSALQASLEPHGVSFPECLSTKESMVKHIEEKYHNTAASVFCSLYINVPASKSMLLSKEGVLGIVALLGSVASTPLSRVLSEYLGEVTMLALVCKSSRPGQNIDPMLQSEAARLERSITSRFHVLCLGATSPWTGGLVENDPQRKLAMDDPKLPDGDPIPGFIGYAVNMIYLAEKELNIKTYKGHGLRETLFYGVFGKLQVYETQTQVEEALLHISGDGAVSLDGFIAKGNEFICSGCSKPEIHFPITVRENEEEKWSNLEEARNRVRRVEKKLVAARCLLSKLEKKMNKANERYDSATKLSLES
ncbi:structural maintenance of chromosomes flexible hinge domain-containing protein GMI1 isoform X2 [Brassica rapa]|uniref:structural maintenance of chromosomes flexible hinge domain-containing protein GMI1 isoform X2 n=1 Tax=Brassica campestris TaxID=3711 RepID=UPI00142DDA91|nr:structural maintenance of chromosomes flexible hinge domain-containing protein GMI1 isoform X2 [Brassica rapa]